jgi:hypothetical protein
MSSDHDNETQAKGVSLARGPALLLGTVLLVAGLYFLYKLHTFPKLSQFPSGDATVDGKAFLGIFGLNGWSGELTAAGGGLLLFGAAQHLAAKTMSLVVGVVFAVVAVIALLHHHSALGLFAANIWTIILWGGSAALLLINTLMPRRKVKAANQEHSGQAIRTVTAVPVEPQPAQRQPGANAVPTTEIDSSTILPERPVVRVRPTDGTQREAGTS